MINIGFYKIWGRYKKFQIKNILKNIHVSFLIKYVIMIHTLQVSYNYKREHCIANLILDISKNLYHLEIIANTLNTIYKKKLKIYSNRIILL